MRILLASIIIIPILVWSAPVDKGPKDKPGAFGILESDFAAVVEAAAREKNLSCSDAEIEATKKDFRLESGVYFHDTKNPL